MTRLTARRAALLALVLATAACSSKAQRAADAMQQGIQLNSAGQYRAAAERFNYAVGLRDDIPALWIARARNQVQMNDYGGAFASYSNALDQDRTNREALDAVGQLSLATNDLDKAKDYASQILTLDPTDINAQLMLASVSFRRGRLDEADGMVDKTLKQDPNAEPALVLKSRILQRRGDLVASERLIAPIFDRGGGSADLRRQLVSIYERTADANGLARVAERDAHDRPRDPDVQTMFAKTLLLIGRLPQAAAILNTIHRVAAIDATRDSTVAMLVDADISLDDVNRMLSTLTTVEPSLAIAVAQYALVRGDAYFAERKLAPLVGNAPLSAGNSDLHATYALALARLGRIPEAARRAAAILAIDPEEPAALTARTLTEIAAKNFDAALRDARIVLRDDPGSAGAYALVAQVYQAQGAMLMANSEITSGFNDNNEDPEFLKLYAAQLVANGRAEDAANIVRSFTIRHAASVAAWTMRNQFCRSAKDAACVARTGAIIDRLHGKAVAMPAAPPEEQIAERDLAQGAPR